MTEFEYLKTVNNAEAAVYETTRKLEKSRKEYNETIERVNKEKKQIYENLKKSRDEIENKKTRLGFHKLVLPKSLKLRIFFTEIIVILIQAIVYIFTSVVFKSTNYGDAAIVFTCVVGIPFLLISLLISLILGEGYLISLVVSIVSILIFYGLSYYSYLLFQTFSISIKGTIIIFTFILSALFASIVYLYTIHKNKKEEVLIKELNKEIVKSKDNYAITKTFTDNKIKSLDNKLSLMKNDLNQIENTLLKNKQYLKSLYAQGVIHPDYRDWNSVCIFIKYFEMGLCNSLKGPDGAYSIYRQEGFKARTISSIDGVSNKINSLASTQSYMASQIAAINYKIDKFIINTYGL